MSDYFFGHFSDLVAPITKNESEVSFPDEKNKKIFRVKELKSNFLNKYIYSALIVFILLLVVVFYLTYL